MGAPVAATLLHKQTKELLHRFSCAQWNLHGQLPVQVSFLGIYVPLLTKARFGWVHCGCTCIFVGHIFCVCLGKVDVLISDPRHTRERKKSSFFNEKPHRTLLC